MDRNLIYFNAHRLKIATIAGPHKINTPTMMRLISWHFKDRGKSFVIRIYNIHEETAEEKEYCRVIIATLRTGCTLSAGIFK